MRSFRPGTILLVTFMPLTALVLWSDSRSVASAVPSGQFLSNTLAALYLAALISQMRPQRRLLALLFVPLSAVGEAIFTLWFGLYHYRLSAIPVYVPLGHSILLSTGLLCADQSWVRLYRHALQRALGLLHTLLIAGALLLFRDTLSAALGSIGAVILVGSPSRARTAYLIIGALVVYVELLGTTWGCWSWHSTPFTGLHTVNPPPGAFVCYVIGEIIAVHIAALVADRWAPPRLERIRRAVA